tara:strand:+ start:5300 stop:5743 length:444 start_codon:yes stop_codon:yes gene_type:complete
MDISNHNPKIKIFSEHSKSDISEFQGKHILLELYGCNREKLNDELYLRCKLNGAAKLANASVLNIVSNKFEPYGVTAIALLAESHLSIHTWPESQYSAIDIFTCGRNMKPDLASYFLIEHLEATNHTVQTIHRNHPKLIEDKIRKAL